MTVGENFATGLALRARTIRQLTLRQILCRILMTARFEAYRRVPALAHAQIIGRADLRDDALTALAGWLERRYPAGTTADRDAVAAMVRAGRFRFVGREMVLGPPPLDWRGLQTSRLWAYHLHYFDYIVALGLAARERGDRRAAEHGWALVDDWLRANPPGSTPGWEPYPTSVRFVNWAAAWALDPDGARALPGGATRLASCLAAQARFVERHLEFHIGGNHLIKNARALVVAGRIFAGAEGSRWSRTGRSLLRRELGRQVLADGGHYERSPLYQAVVLEDIVDCAEVDGDLAELGETAMRMAKWLGLMSHPDGGLALFNDTVAFPDPSPREILAYVTRVTGAAAVASADRIVSLSDSGYYVIGGADAGRMIVDCGEIGPPELAAHAHADALSYEFALNGRRLVVDSGVPGYQQGIVRSYVRSTGAHNTVVVDDADQSEVWASHRVGRRAHPLGASLEAINGGARFVGAHDGYASRAITHHRHVLVLGAVWIILDELLGRGEHRYSSFVHVHSDLVVAGRPAEPRIRIREGPALIQLVPLGAESVVIQRGIYCPEWGTEEPNDVVRLDLRQSAPAVFGYAFIPLDADVQVSYRQLERGLEISVSTDGAKRTVTSERVAGLVSP